MPYFIVSIFLVLPVWALMGLTARYDPWVVGALALVPSLVGFALIADDKSRARRGLRRTPESALHFVELLGGWPGSYLGQQRFRHKTFKTSYRFKLWAIVALHQLVAIDALRGWPLLEIFRRALGS